MAVRVAIGLGSNLGDRRANLDGAVRALRRLGRDVKVSAYHETDPVGGPAQGRYLNAVAVLDTELPARDLLDELLAIERAAGRTRDTRWGPRTLDLDLLLYGERRIDEPGLSVPHPRMAERPFVLGPLGEVWPDARYPDGTRVVDAAPETPPPALLVFLVTGLAAVGIWWLFDLLLT